jgi:hypothetical protein
MSDGSDDEEAGVEEGARNRKPARFRPGSPPGPVAPETAGAGPLRTPRMPPIEPRPQARTGGRMIEKVVPWLT